MQARFFKGDVKGDRAVSLIAMGMNKTGRARAEPGHMRDRIREALKIHDVRPGRIRDREGHAKGFTGMGVILRGEREVQIADPGGQLVLGKDIGRSLIPDPDPVCRHRHGVVMACMTGAMVVMVAMIIMGMCIVVCVVVMTVLVIVMRGCSRRHIEGLDRFGLDPDPIDARQLRGEADLETAVRARFRVENLKILKTFIHHHHVKLVAMHERKIVSHKRFAIRT